MVVDELDNSKTQDSLPKNNRSVKSFIKVRLSDGSFQTIIPISNTSSVICASGRTLDLELDNITNDIILNSSSIEELCGETNIISSKLDIISGKIQSIENSLEEVISKLNKVITDNNNLSKTVSNLSDKLSSHEDTIV